MDDRARGHGRVSVVVLEPSPRACRELARGRATTVVVRRCAARVCARRGRRDRPSSAFLDDALEDGIEIETGRRWRRSSSSKTTTIALAGASTNRARRRLRGGGGGDAGDDGGVRASGDR